MFWRRTKQPQPAYLVFGLGNPGINYMRSRHNIGWWVLDELARRHSVERTFHKHRGQADTCTINGQQVVLVKPTTYMNRSGQCIAAWHREYPDAGFVVVFDDFSMKTGKLRFRRDGRSGGNNGIESIIGALKTDSFDRLKIGIGNPGDEDPADYVLSAPTRSEEEQIQPAVVAAADTVELLVDGDYQGVQDLLARLTQTPREADQPGQEK